ncbi:SET domain-containing protein [Lophium mytilinum]|uniref:SET domain-containing protein n=1 Tax=Lophium mytilinum TaxID=390894 RepID=A0A6A6R1J7_9PEZI|nr:SET domain-containing protein [Lophium mytilinum]
MASDSSHTLSGDSPPTQTPPSSKESHKARITPRKIGIESPRGQKRTSSGVYKGFLTRKGSAADPHLTHSTTDTTHHTQIEKYETPHAGHGLRAAQPMPRGTCIFSESAIVSHPWTEDGEEYYTTPVLEQCFKLSEAKQQEIISLQNVAKPDTFDEWLPWIRSLWWRLEEAENDIPQSLANNLPDVLKMPLSAWPKKLRLQNELAQAVRAYNLICAWETHNRKITNVHNPKKFHYGLFLNTARLNHSCIPNARISYCESRGMMTAYALSDIKAGEELTISYLEDERTADLQNTTIFMKRDERQAQLKQKWEFECTCHVCKNAEVSAAWDDRVTAMKPIRAFFSKIDAPWAPFWKFARLKELGRAVEEGMKLLRMVEKQGPKNIEVARIRETLARLNSMMGRDPAAILCARISLEVAGAVMGKDHQRYDQARCLVWEVESEESQWERDTRRRLE